MRIAIATDAWTPQVNGVVRTLHQTAETLESFGHEVKVLHPGMFKTVPCPTYPSIPLALLPGAGIGEALRGFAPDAVHVATEGPIGHAARRWCIRRSKPFTTSFHTQFPEYIRARAPLPISWSYAYIRRFHHAAVRTLVPTQTQVKRLADRRFEHLVLWSRGVDTAVFKPYGRGALALPGPILMYMGRVAVEKNIEAFLSLKTPASQVVVGDSPDRHKLQSAFPHAHFLGAKFGADLARHVAAADVFVFPSRTDTFGLVLLEALACGVPVAAYPVTGPIDVIDNGVTGVLDADLDTAVRGALKLDRKVCAQAAQAYSWARCTRQFESYLEFAPMH
ncbi:MAG: glycosyltransferase [Gammaproteobacteria bacterium]|nr:glycosyltransferase [Gammaproteobacteria bacterium]